MNNTAKSTSTAKPEHMAESQHAKANLVASFSIHDSWFFRESRGHDAIGVSELGSVFPPPPSTLAGALKSWLGDTLGVDWARLAQHDQHLQLPDGESLSARQLLGSSEQLSMMGIEGPWLCCDNQRLYPLPALLLASSTRGIRQFHRLSPGKAVHCDLGRVRLPGLHGNATVGSKALAQVWVSEQGLEQILNGGLPESGQVINTDALVTDEARLGIARDNRRGTVREGKLYQTRHLRAVESLRVECGVTGLPGSLHQRLDQHRSLVRLGGEGRQAELLLSTTTTPLPEAPAAGDPSQLVLCLLTAARFEEQGRPSWLPEGFSALFDAQGIQRWRGMLNGVALEIESAVLGKAAREGGWDMQHHRPKPVRSLVPAGSCYFCRVLEGDSQNAIMRLHGTRIGRERELGRGWLACGVTDSRW